MEEIPVEKNIVDPTTMMNMTTTTMTTEEEEEEEEIPFEQVTAGPKMIDEETPVQKDDGSVECAPSVSTPKTTPLKSRGKIFLVSIVLVSVVVLGAVAGLTYHFVSSARTSESSLAIEPPSGYSSSGLPLYSCGEADGIVSLPSGTRVALTKAKDGFVCLLSRVSDGITYGRSYDTNDWESTASTSRSAVSLLFSNCDSESCEVDIPAGDGDDEGYQLVSLSHSITNEQEISRFLAQATFGPTRNDIDSFLSSPGSFKEWISDQMYDVPATLHREYFRSRANQRMLQATTYVRPRLPCEPSSRWHSFAFTNEDIGKTIEVVTLGDKYSFRLLDRDVILTEVGEWPLDWTEFIVCQVDEESGGEVKITATDGSCSTDTLQTIPNPTINFSSDPAQLLNVSSDAVELVELEPPITENRLLKILPTTECSAPAGEEGIFLKDAEGGYWKVDPRMKLIENTLDSPATPETLSDNSQLCSNPEVTFLNRESCLIVEGNACEPPRYRSKMVMLNETNLRHFYTKSGRFVYSIDGLRLGEDASPCDKQRSRWVLMPASTLPSSNGCGDEASNDSLTAGTLETLVSLLRDSKDSNTFLRDIYVPKGAVCDPSGTSQAKLEVSGSDGSLKCWQFVHHNLYDVFDFTEWGETDAHPGNEEADMNDLPNPIKRWAAIEGSTVLRFPSYHPMNRWKNEDHLRLGRIGDEIDFVELPSEVQSKALASELGALYDEEPESEISHSQVCGSPGEVANVPSLGSRFSFEADDLVRNRTEDVFFYNNVAKSTWIMIAQSATDQLRQRVAFALSGILVVGWMQKRTHEARTSFYDIFVRHAFGNYRDVLKEVTFHPIMGDYLTYKGSAAYAFYERYPDENYAREIMQLFTIGLVKLYTNGTVIMDEATGEPVPTYDNDHIMSFARIWTGFQSRGMRGNLDGYENNVDPMQVKGSRHDVFPKLDLDGDYIGDKYPLCVDLPSRDFLRKGAIYEYIGSTSEPSVDLDETNSALYTALCNRTSSGGPCRHSPTLILDKTLECFGIECTVDVVNVVKVGAVAYQHSPRPCVSFQFFNGGRRAGVFGWKGKRDEVCLHPKEADAGEICCGESYQPERHCLYPNERVTYATAEKRCIDRGMRMCDELHENPLCSTSCCDSEFEHTWSNRECSLQVKINSDGYIAVLHDVEYPYKALEEDVSTWFHVDWLEDDSEVPNMKTNGCGTCTISDSACICDINVVDSPVFQSMPTRMQILSQLSVGSPPLDVFDDGAFVEEGSLQDGVRAFRRADQDAFDADTIFEIEDDAGGNVVYLRNVKSTVEIAGGAKFRNPPTFLSIIDHSNDRRALYEVDALLDHLLSHSNTAPFIAYRLIQRLVTSNPSPRFVEVAAKAFRSGKYEGFGSGKNGDLAATVAAILLDPEARSVALDADPAHGHLREPLLKLIYVMRALEFQTIEPETQIEFRKSLDDSIGQMVHEAPTVFSYFRPEFSPSGSRAGDMGLASPESEVITAATSVSFLNAMRSLVKWGLTNRESGPGIRGDAAAKMMFQPSDVIEELDLLLTNGRLSDKVRSIIIAEYQSMLEEKTADIALRYATQLFFTSPEFQISNAHKSLPSKSVVETSLPEPSRNGPLKSPRTIVFVDLEGGADSYNMLIPHSDCIGGDLYSQYSEIRDSVALDKEEILLIDVPTGTQPCNKFGMHPNLETMHALYNDGDLLWFANAGSLVEPVTRDNMDNKETPTNNFAHNIMTRYLEQVHTNSRTEVGVLGRISDALTGKGFQTGAFSMRRESKIQDNNPGKSDPTDFVSKSNFEILNPSTMLRHDEDHVVTRNLTESSSSVFGDYWSSTLQRGINRTSLIRTAAEANPLKADETLYWKAGTLLEDSLKQVARLMAGREVLGRDRNTFSVGMGGFDAHKSLHQSLNLPLLEVDASLDSFVAEMKAQGMWDEVVVVVASEFGRSLISNGQGTDHGWGGNYFIMGGAVKGGRILGDYPDDLTEDNPLLMSRARVIPTTPWESIWNGIAQWFGVDEDQLDEVLPLRRNFPNLFTEDDLFETT